MVHYICTGGCGGVSDNGGTCNAKDCIKYHHPLTVCNCSDGKHEEAFQNPNRKTEDQQVK